MNETEILIIGGGIAGASTAYHLAQYGRQVTLVERNDIASEASGVNAGAIGALGWGNVPNLESYLTMGSLEIFKSLQVELGYDIEFRRSGSLQAIQTEAEYAYIQKRAIGVALSRLHRGPLVHPGSANDRAGTQPGIVGMFIYAPQSASRSHEGDTGIRKRGGAERGAHTPES